MKEDFEVSIKMLQVISNDVVIKNENLDKLILSLIENVATGSGEKLNTKLETENATLCDSMQDLKQKYDNAIDELSFLKNQIF